MATDTSAAAADPTSTTAGSHASPLVWRARSTNVDCRDAAAAVPPTNVAANSSALSTDATTCAWR